MDAATEEIGAAGGADGAVMVGGEVGVGEVFDLHRAVGMGRSPPRREKKLARVTWLVGSESDGVLQWRE